jgi:hypothetical protein
MKYIPLTREEILAITDPIDRLKAIRNYENWRKEERIKVRKEKRQIENKEYRILHKDVVKESKDRWNKNNPIKLKMYSIKSQIKRNEKTIKLKIQNTKELVRIYRILERKVNVQANDGVLD